MSFFFFPKSLKKKIFVYREGMRGRSKIFEKEIKIPFWDRALFWELEFTLIKEATNYLHVPPPEVNGTPGDQTALVQSKSQSPSDLSMYCLGRGRDGQPAPQ